MSNKLIPGYYVHLYLNMLETARTAGYALTLQGSMARDLDLVAVPWTADCKSASELLAALIERHGLIAANSDDPIKPHGRTAHVLAIGGEYYIDLSFMPTVTP